MPMGSLNVENNWFNERWFAEKVIGLSGITCDQETEILILTDSPTCLHYRDYIPDLTSDAGNIALYPAIFTNP